MLDNYLKENIYFDYKKRNKLTRIELAKRLETSEQTLKRFEHYNGKLSLQLIANLLALTNKTIYFKKTRPAKKEYYY